VSAKTAIVEGLAQRITRGEVPEDWRQMTLEISPEARRFIAEQGFDPIYGARPLRGSSPGKSRPGSGVRCWLAMPATVP
jgi:ATP-dependent Clp protease ATP-binding subunit ClpA